MGEEEEEEEAVDEEVENSRLAKAEPTRVSYSCTE